MANPDIGLIDCPCCEFSGAHVRETAKKRAYVVCDECSSQTFSRGSVSDASIRRRMVPVAAAAEDHPLTEKELETMPPTKKPAAKKAPAKAPAKAPPKAPAAPAAQSQDEDDDGFGGLVSGGKRKTDDDGFGKFVGS